MFKLLGIADALTSICTIIYGVVVFYLLYVTVCTAAIIDHVEPMFLSQGINLEKKRLHLYRDG